MALKINWQKASTIDLSEYETKWEAQNQRIRDLHTELWRKIQDVRQEIRALRPEKPKRSFWRDE